MTLQRTGRAIVYTNQVPYEADVLRTNMYKMADIATLAQTVLGTGLNNGTLMQGGNCTPTDPASFSVNIAPITIYQNEAYDSTAYGVIPSDTSDILYKQGINLGQTVVSSLNPPLSGTNYYLIQAQLHTQDVNNVNRPFYNSDNPADPIFEENPDTRVDSVLISTKVSTSSTPAPDAGFVGLWAVTVAFGQPNITSGDITQYSDAPFITESLTQKISQATADTIYMKPSQEQSGQYVYAEDTGTANAIVVTFDPAITSLTSGSLLRVKAAATNTGATTISVNGLASKTIKKQDISGLVALSGGEIIANQIYLLIYDGADFEVINPTIDSDFSGALVVLPIDQTISGSGEAIIQFSAASITDQIETYDTDGYWDAPNYQFVIPKDGYYKFSLGLFVSNHAEQPFWGEVAVLRSAAVIQTVSLGGGIFSTSSNQTSSGSITLKCQANDVARGLINSLAGSSYTLNDPSSNRLNFFSIEYVGSL